MPSKMMKHKIVADQLETIHDTLIKEHVPKSERELAAILLRDIINDLRGLPWEDQYL